MQKKSMFMIVFTLLMIFIIGLAVINAEEDQKEITIIGDTNKNELMLLFEEEGRQKFYIKKEEYNKLINSKKFLKNKDFEITVYSETTDQDIAKTSYKEVMKIKESSPDIIMDFKPTTTEAIWVARYNLSYKGGSRPQGILKDISFYDDHGNIILKSEENMITSLDATWENLFAMYRDHSINSLFIYTNVNLVKKYNEDKPFKDKIQPEYFEIYSFEGFPGLKNFDFLSYLFKDEQFKYYTTQKAFFLYSEQHYTPSRMSKFLNDPQLFLLKEPKNQIEQERLQKQVEILLQCNRLEIIEEISDKEIWLVAELFNFIEAEKFNIISRVYYNKNGEIVYVQLKGFMDYNDSKENIDTFDLTKDGYYPHLIKNIKDFLMKIRTRIIKEENKQKSS